MAPGYNETSRDQRRVLRVQAYWRGCASDPRENAQWVLKRLPEGLVQATDFEWQSVPVPEPSPGEVLVRVRVLSCDPTQRGWLNGMPTYVPPVMPGQVMRAWGAGEVVGSRHPGFAAGDRVTCKLDSAVQIVARQGL